MAAFKNNFWGEKNAGFDVLYHNMKHGQIATKELAEFVRERAAIEETYSKSMSKLAKMASSGSPLGTFAPLWDVFRVSSDKLALCHLELMRKMNDLIRDINKYGDEQVKIHRKTKEEVVGTLEAVQALQVQSGQLQKAREAHHARYLEMDRLRKESAPQKELEKAEQKSKKAAEVFAGAIEKFNRVGGDFEQKMCDSAQKFQDIEEAHLKQMKQLIKGYSHSIEDTHVQVGQVHEEFKQNLENIGIENLVQKFTDQKGTGKERPAPVCFEEYLTSSVPTDVGKKSRGKAFRIPGLGKRDKEPDSTDSAVTEAPNSPLEVDDEGFVIRADGRHNGCADDKDSKFYSSDSDFDDDEPKKFHIQIRPVATSNRGNTAAHELELKATVGALSLPPTTGVSVKRHLSRNSSTTGGRSEGEGDVHPHREGEQRGLRRSTSSPDPSRLTSAVTGPDALFGPPLEAFKSSSFAGQDQLRGGFGASEYAAFSSDSSSPENVEDSGLDSPSHQPLGPSPEPSGWAAWPPPTAAPSTKEASSLRRPPDPFLSAFREPSPARTPLTPDEVCAWGGPGHSPCVPPEVESGGGGGSAFCFPPILRSQALPDVEATVWNCTHLPQEDPFLAAFEPPAHQEALALPQQDAWAPAAHLHPSRKSHAPDPFSVPLGKDSTKTLPPPSSSSSSSSARKDRKRDRSVPPPLESPLDNPFAITMIGSPTHQASLAVAAVASAHGSAVSSKPSTAHPSAAHSVAAHPSAAHSVAAHPSAAHSVAAHSSTAHPSAAHSVAAHSVAAHSSTAHPSAAHPSAAHSVAAHPSTAHPSSAPLPKAPSAPATNPSHPKKELQHWGSVHNNPFSSVPQGAPGGPEGSRGPKQRGAGDEEPRRNGPPLTRHSGPQEDLCFSTDKDQDCLDMSPRLTRSRVPHTASQHSFRQDSSELLVAAPPHRVRSKRTSGQLGGCERSRSLCSSPLPDPSPTLTSSSSSSPSEWGGQTRAPSPARVGLSRGPSPISVSTQEAWPVATAITEYINAYFKGGQHNRCLVKITGDLTMSFPAGITRVFTANPNAPILSFRLLNVSRLDHFLPNQKLLYNDPSQSDPDFRDFWFNMQALTFHLQREAELNPQASYYNVGLLKYQVSSQDPGRAPLLLSAECQRSGSVTRISLDYHCCPATAPSTQLTAVQVLLPLDHTATDLQCQPAATWNAEERRLLWKLPNLSPTNHSKGSGTLCASWQCLVAPRGPPPSLAVQFVGCEASLSGLDLELLGTQYRMSLVKKRFATGKYMAGCSL
ncbi:F-BAR domain only protein 1 isoform X2 [Alosa sapidissima]|nr:F-BAR domain only protein 1 isoform X2 [Alosa sapidissima]XP_041967461.1 F-BAR domain only protein 1 isoform X2 [Alosa sapidissima]